MLLAIGVHARASPHQEEIPAALAPGGTAFPAPRLPAGPEPGSSMETLGRCSGSRAAGTEAGEWVAPSPQPQADLAAPLILNPNP